MTADLVRLLDALSISTFDLFLIERTSKWYRCELRPTDKKARCWLTLHTAEPLNWDHAYNWEELRAFPCWVNGQKIVVPKEKLARRPVRGKPLYIVQGG